MKKFVVRTKLHSKENIDLSCKKTLLFKEKSRKKRALSMEEKCQKIREQKRKRRDAYGRRSLGTRLLWLPFGDQFPMVSVHIEFALVLWQLMLADSVSFVSFLFSRNKTGLTLAPFFISAEIMTSCTLVRYDLTPTF